MPDIHTIPGIVPVFEDKLSTIQALADIKAWADVPVGSDFFADGVFNRGGIAKITTGTEYMIPEKGPMLVSAFAQTLTTEDNTKDFYNKQDMLFYQEARMFDDWVYAIQHKEHTPVTATPSTGVYSRNNGSTFDSSITYTVGPYVDLSLMSEANKYYGLSSSKKSAWLQRSLTRGINFLNTSRITTVTSNAIEATWSHGIASTIGQAAISTYADVRANGGDLFAAAYTTYLHGAGGQPTWDCVNLGFDSEVTGIPNTTDRQVKFNYTITVSGVPGATQQVSYKPQDGGGEIDNTDYSENLPGGLGVYLATTTRTQTFYCNATETVYYDACTYKQLGYTKIKNKGYWNTNNTIFTLNSPATPEAADYVDQCSINKRKNAGLPAFGNGLGEGLLDPVNNTLDDGTLYGEDNRPDDDLPLSLTNPQLSIPAVPFTLVQACLGDSVTIDGQDFTYPTQALTLPPTSFLLQDGSIEPIYPEFIGAYVYDLQYKKWGKMFQPHKQLLNYSPINTHAGDGNIPTDIFSVNAGCLLSSGKLAIFDKYPSNSIIKIGKIGYYRNGYTDCEGVSIQFRSQASGSISIEGSLDGKLINPAITQQRSYNNVVSYRAGFNSSARWYNICISGIYDIKNIDFHGWKKGKR